MRKYFLFVMLSIVLLLSACSMGPTVVTVKSDPPGAQVVLKDMGIHATTDTEIKIPDKLFEQGNSDREFRNEIFMFTLDGYRKKEAETRLQKHVPADVHARLYKIDTKLTVKSDPPGALVTLSCDSDQNMTREK